MAQNSSWHVYNEVAQNSGVYVQQRPMAQTVHGMCTIKTNDKQGMYGGTTKINGTKQFMACVQRRPMTNRACMEVQQRPMAQNSSWRVWRYNKDQWHKQFMACMEVQQRSMAQTVHGVYEGTMWLQNQTTQINILTSNLEKGT